MSSARLVDQEHRELALDVSSSYIVQAPAGSGKTELLTLRYLKLLAICDQPEEVLAITFTRKAASEMRARILNLLRKVHEQSAAHTDGGQIPFDNPLEQQRYNTGRQVLDRNEELGWRLLENPSRLRVQTIDSFCHYLAAQLPVLSQIGGNPTVSDDVEPCFVDAVENTLAKLDSEHAIADNIEQLLRHLDNDRNRAQTLLVSLLYKRDQWLSYILELGGSPDEARSYLLANLQELIEETLFATHAEISAYTHTLLPLIDYALGNLHEADDTKSSDYVPMTDWPACSSEGLADWLQVTEALLTKSDTWRKQVNVKSGFPPGKKGDTASLNKQQMTELLAELTEQEQLRQLLAELRTLPDSQIESDQWQFLTALLNVLADLAKELQLSFRRFGIIDHPQTSAAALAALGSEQEPTDIALALDHRLQHILVDEFQDTSKVQLGLLKQLTAGWQNGDGRTLFLVGDAMQSCYGFRDANVGIYLDVRERGINDIHLEPLTLQANFRSQQKVVAWVNSVFASAFPEQANSSRGAVPYSASEASNPELPHFGVRTTLVTYDTQSKELARDYEAELIVKRIQELQASDPGADIAVLVRSRPHFEPLIPRLRAAKIHWQATDIDRLATVPVVTDLLSLTRALVNPADRLAWLAVLRAPWCGIDTSALQAICTIAEQNSIYSALQDSALRELCGAENWRRLEPVIAILDYGMRYRSRVSLHRLIEAVWTLLRGPACCDSQVEIECARRYLQLLREQETAESLDNFARFEEKLRNTYVPSSAQAQNQTESGTVHLLTMHKAKGLEYDHVILPALTQKSGGMDAKSLLLWHERLNADGVPRLFLGSLSAAGDDDTRLYSYLKNEKQLKESLESTRLLYIAVTRAIKSAHLFGRVAIDESKGGKGESTEVGSGTALRKPGSDSLLAKIWPQLEEQSDHIELVSCSNSDSATTDTGDNLSSDKADTYRRFNEPIQLSEYELGVISAALQPVTASLAEPSQDQLSFSHDSISGERLASVMGTLVHEALELFTASQSDDAPGNRISILVGQLRTYWQTMLQRLDLESGEIEQKIAQMKATLETCVTDTESAWLFAMNNEQAQSELSLISTRHGHISEHKIDRTLVDESGTRWIVDYKTSQPHAGQTEDEFVTQQLQEYAPQLERYRKLFSAVEDRPIRMALYLTALPRLVEWQSAE